jgi:cation diffusion facilitator family transporter
MPLQPLTNLQLQRFIVFFGVLLLATKFIAYLITHSNAILTDALESIVNVAAALLGWYSLWLSAKPRDRDHPYGHGKIEFLSAGIEGSLILFAGVMIVGKSVYNFFHPQQLESLDLGLSLVLATGLINFAAGFYAEKQGEKTGSLALVGSGQHLKSDAYSTFGIVIGLVLILLFRFEWLDNAIAVILGGWIIYTGTRVTRRAVAGIMDEADSELLEKLIGKLNENRREPWVDLHNMRVIKYGPVWHIDCHLTVPWYYSVREAHREVEQFNELVRKEFHNPVEFFIHTDYCLPPQQCKICVMSACNQRTAAFEKGIEWDSDNVLNNNKHGLNSP